MPETDILLRTDYTERLKSCFRGWKAQIKKLFLKYQKIRISIYNPHCQTPFWRKITSKNETKLY